jgi:(S)-2-hydroxyglutarate dehydrogenase
LTSVTQQEQARADVVVVGGGIVGLAVARELTQRLAGAHVVVLEKEDGVARHQTGRNSGVIHSGIYYRPGSLKATLAVRGSHSMVEYCQEHGIAHDVCGKLIVATDEAQRPQLDMLAERSAANGIEAEVLTPEAARELEPHVRCVAALHVTPTGIVDYGEVSEVLAGELAAAGAEVRLRSRVTGLQRTAGGWAIETARGPLSSRFVVTCGGLQSDRLARLAGDDPKARIVPFRGEYFDVVPARRHLVNGLVYPVPDLRFPFLGVHLTRNVHGDLHAGPNAVFALAREGYRWRDVDLRDLGGAIAYPGFWRMARTHWRYGIGEVHRSVRRAVFVRAVQELVPELEEADLVRAPAGVRAQAVARDGGLVDDFLLVDADRALHVTNAPSPAATASLEIGRVVADRVEARLGEWRRRP